MTRPIRPGLIVSSQINDGPVDFPYDGTNWWKEMALARAFLGDGDFPVREIVDALPSDIPIGVEVLSEEFQERGLSPTAMAQYLMDNVKGYFQAETVAN